ncbi:glycosyltransferase family 2 protein [Dysgonomonas sp. ZJ279]|uniref:glycosyltransferase family 2 protein n=1 Tax=Dysgonomonas sp. ZJ279 TaxID=2709796 RepID=UPI0013EC10EC|nr:glycosyltransferase family 2 protein [Dysgonomonas sp. ZJ279]
MRIKSKDEKPIGYSVIMPTYNQSSFIRRAIFSLIEQTYKNWELIIINDGSSDDTEECINDFIINHPQIRYIKNQCNMGLGYAINQGLNIAKYDYIAYLPSDDIYYKDHLSSFTDKFNQSKDTSLVFSGLRFGNIDSLYPYKNTYESNHIRPDHCLQLVQTAHRKTAHRWLERKEWITDDLFLMFWNKLINTGSFVSTGIITCFWTNHPHQHHRIAGERYGGGLNAYRSYYKVVNPLRMRLSKYKFIDEEKIYAPFRKSITKKKRLKILLVGELAYNPERIYALEEYGHVLYGLWVRKPEFTFTNVGHLPFGNVEDIPYDNWRETVSKIKPDIIYALANWDGVEIAHEVLKSKLSIPFVWHFKESPIACMKNGTWKELYELYKYADGKIFINKMMKRWYELFVPSSENSFILDLDMPKRDCFNNDFSTKISATDKGSIHTVVAGRIIGITETDIAALSNQNIHVHLYSENEHHRYDAPNQLIKKMAPDHFHIHTHVSSSDWVKEFSKYDAGWLHCFNSCNEGNLLQTTWDDLNIPARIYTLVAAGIPSLQKDNTGHFVAMQNLVKDLNIGMFYKNISDLAMSLREKNTLEDLNKSIMKCRDEFTFDYHVERLSDFFYKIMENSK